jgi:stringent starvation protein B
MHEWMTDGGQTPHLVVDISFDGVDVPRQYAEEGRIVLNASYSATHNFAIGNERVTFQARFGGASKLVDVPIEAVVGIYARESGEGLMFADDVDRGSVTIENDDSAPGTIDSDPVESDSSNAKPNGGRPPHLRIIK